jgi:transketolase
MGTAKAAYFLADADGGQLDVIPIGTTSEMSFCADTYEQLTPEGIKARMVSKPPREFFLSTRVRNTGIASRFPLSLIACR